MRPSLATLKLLNGSPYCSKSERAVNPDKEDWVLLANKFAAMRLESAIAETERSSNDKHTAGDQCWLDKIFVGDT
jgi:hypothetical protein